MGRFKEYRMRLKEEISTQNTAIGVNDDQTPLNPYSAKYANKDNRIPTILGKTTKRKLKKKKRDKITEREVKIQPINTNLKKTNKGVNFEKIITLVNEDPRESYKLIFNKIASDLTKKKSKTGYDLKVNHGDLKKYLNDNVGSKLEIGSFLEKKFLSKNYKIMVMDSDGVSKTFD